MNNKQIEIRTTAVEKRFGKTLLFKNINIQLVCGFLHGYSASKLATVVSESLKEDPLSGRAYAFCNKGQNTITVLAWQDPIYSIAKYVKTHGTFIWPQENLGKTIEITKSEFDRLLFLEKYKKHFKNKRKFPK